MGRGASAALVHPQLLGVLFVFIRLRTTLPRLRYDQPMRFGWKILLPLRRSTPLTVLVVVGF